MKDKKSKSKEVLNMIALGIVAIIAILIIMFSVIKDK